MNCIEFRRLLDEGVRAHEHAATCSECAEELRIAIELDRLLSVVVPGVVREDFNDVVLRKIHATSGRRRVLDGFVQLFAEPLVAISLALAAMMAWQYEALAIAARQVVSMIDGHSGDAALVFAFVLAPLMAWISWRIFRMFEFAARPAACDPAPLHTTIKGGHHA